MTQTQQFLDAARVFRQLRHIVGIKPTGVINGDLRRRPRKQWAAEVRGLLRWFRIEGVSVTTPRYSMASSIDISLPDLPHEHGPEVDKCIRNGEAVTDLCDVCSLRSDARDAIERIVLGAFPDLDDRSDCVSDYFDFCFSVS